MMIVFHVLKNLLVPGHFDFASLALAIVMKITLAIVNAPPLRLTLRAI